MDFLNLLLYRLKRPFHFFKTGLLRGLPAQIKYGFPARRLKIIAITGTDGKTTSSTLLYQILKKANKKVALITTVAAYIGDQEIETGFHVTSPNPADLHKLMRKMVNQGIEYLILEVTSHGAYQHRTWGIRPFLAGVTNVSHEHLDYHQSYLEYLRAKAIILRKSPVVVLNSDDKSYPKLRKLLNKKTRIITYSLSDRIANSVNQAIRKRFPEEYNHLNSRLVYFLTKYLEIKPSVVAEAIENFSGVAGRMEEIKNTRGWRVVVDFAHTPKALEEALTALRQQLHDQYRSGRLIAVFGCAGLRDRAKRPLMGGIASQLADISIFTAEDPRTEDVWSIIRQMKEGLQGNHDKIISIADRRQAIDFALTKIARKGDIVGIFGKGPEKSMSYGTTEHPWSDVGVIKEIL